MKIVIFSLLVVSLVHAAAPPADDADALRRRVVILESQKSALETKNALLLQMLKDHGKVIIDAQKRLLAMKEEMEVMRVELGVPPKPPGPDMPLFDEYVDTQRRLMPPSMDDAVAARLADKDKATTAEVVVRGVVEVDPAQPKDEWPTYNLVVAHVFKAPPNTEPLLGTMLTVRTKRTLKGPVTLYLVFDKEQKVYRLQDGERGFSHMGSHAASEPVK